MRKQAGGHSPACFFNLFNSFTGSIAMAESLNSQLEKYTLDQLNTIKTQAERELLARSKKNRAYVIKQIKELCSEYDISATDLFNVIEPTAKKKLEQLSQQRPIDQALDVIAQGRDYIKQKNAEFASTTRTNQSFVNLYEVDDVKNDDDATPSALSMLMAKLAAAGSKRNLVNHIDSTQQHQLQRLSTVILKTIETGNLTSRELKAVLTDDEYDNYLSRCSEPSPNDVYAAGVPSYFDNYKDFVREGDFHNSKADTLAKKRNRTYINGQSSASFIRNKAESCYEKAIECLEELHGTADWDVAQQWLDRDVNFTEHGCEPSACVVGVPRLRNSKSQYAQQTMPKSDKYLKKRLAAIETLCDAIETIIYEPDTYVTPSSTEQSKSLRDFITSIDDDLNLL